MNAKPTLVLLHAFGASAKSWGAVVDHLGGDLDVVAPDLPGFGEAPDSLQADSVQDYGAWVLAEIERRGIGEFILIGWSMGGKIALATALHQPKGLKGLILVAPSPPGPEPMEPGAREQERQSFGDPHASREALKSAAGDGIAKAPLDHAVEQRLAATRPAWDFWLDVGSKEDLTAQVLGLDLPILVITGDEDDHLGEEAVAEHVKPYLAHLSEVIIQGSGHLIPYEQPQALAIEISRYVDALTKGSV